MNKKILIVDDEEKVRKLVEVTLSVTAAALFLAANGDEALELARKIQPDVVLLDIMMPGKLDGFEVCRLLKQDPDTRDMHIIMLTAKGQKIDRERGLTVGADDYIIKPFSPIALMEKVEGILEER